MQIQLVNHLHQAVPTQTVNTLAAGLNHTDSEQSQSSQSAVTGKDSADSAGRTEDQEEKTNHRTITCSRQRGAST